MGRHNTVVTSGRAYIFPATGFQSDIEVLLQKFVETKTVRFEEFSRLWREGNYSLIHAGRRGMREKREFCEEAFKIVLKFLVPPYSTQVRIGSLYLLYALYNTQRTIPKVRIRVPLACLQNLQDLHNDVIASKHLDTDYIIRKMKNEGMFEYCAYPSHLTIEDLYKCDHESDEVGDVNTNQVSHKAESLFNKLWDEDNIGQLNAVHEKYHQLKCLQNADRGGDPKMPSNSLDLIQNDVVTSILQITQDKEQTVVTSPKHKTQPEPEQASESSKRARLVHDIKARAAAARANTDSGALRFLNTSPPLSRKQDDPVTPPKRRKGRPYNRPSDDFDPNIVLEDGDHDSEEITPKNLTPKLIPSKKLSNEVLDDFLIAPNFDNEENSSKTKENEGTAFSLENDGTSSLALHENDTFQNGGNSSPVATKNDAFNKKKEATIEKSEKVTKKKRMELKVPNNEESLAIELIENKFVVLKPLLNYEEEPIVGKVIAFNDKTVEIIRYKGTYTTKWTESKTGTGVDKKFIKETIPREKVLLANLSLTSVGRLPVKISNQLKKMYLKLKEQS